MSSRAAGLLAKVVADLDLPSPSAQLEVVDKSKILGDGNVATSTLGLANAFAPTGAAPELNYFGTRKRPSRRVSKTAENIEPAHANGVSTGSTDGVPPTMDGPPVAGGRFDGGDRAIVIDYALGLLAHDSAEHDVARLVDTLSDLHRDAPLQHAVSLNVINRVLTSRGHSLEKLVGMENDKEAESLMQTSLFVGGQFSYPEKAIEEALMVLRRARSPAAVARDERGILRAYLADAFPSQTPPEKIEFVADAMMSTSRPGAFRRIAHLARFAVGLAKRGLTLRQVLQMELDEAGQLAWEVLSEEGQPGSAGFETFLRLYQREHPEALASGGESDAVTAALRINPDFRQEELVLEVARYVYRRPFEDVVRVLTEYFGRANRDALTKAHDGRQMEEGRGKNEMLRETVDSAREYVRQTGAEVHMISGDFINLSGLNAHYSNIQADADVDLKDLYDLLKQILRAHLGDNLVDLRIGGDEFVFIAIHVSQTKVERAVAAAIEAVNAMVEERGLDKIAPGKKDTMGGSGWHLGYTKILPDTDLDTLRRINDAQINDSKKRHKLGHPESDAE